MEWISFKDKPPNPGQRIIFTDGENVTFGIYSIFSVTLTGEKQCYLEDLDYCSLVDIDNDNIRWMSLPNVPV
jgi:hypothetical protein